MRSIPIKNFLDKVPGGIVIIPLLIGCCLNTFCPGALQIGSFTTGIAGGTAAYVGALFLCLGAQMDLKCAKQSAITGTTLVIVKYGVAVAIGLAVQHFMHNSLLGLGCLAIIAGVSNSNGGMFATLTSQYGSESDRGAVAIICVNDGPFLTMIAMGAAGAASIPYMSIIASIVPLVIGCILGNLDPKMREMLHRGEEIIILLTAFAIGCTMNFGQVLQGGMSGVVLGLIALVIGGFFCIIADRLTGGTGIAGAAISSIAANAIATPAIMAAIDPALEATSGIATAQLASACLVTCILCPFLTAWVYKQNQKKRDTLAAP